MFHRPDLVCTRCHTAGEDGPHLGPDLAKVGKEATDIYLMESILFPSKVIKKGFETVIITTKAGKTVTGLLAEERGDAVVLRDAAQDGKPITILKKDIDERNDKGPSLMPEGLINVLSGRQEFLDLTRYLMEIAEKGPDRARQLRPAASLFAPPPLPDYERDLDHAGLIRSLDRRSYQRGKAIYVRVCANCHGTKEQAGSMPTSLRFAEGKFKNGADPFRMYQTLTHGFGMMTPQTWMVPQQKYDVIHFIREAYLKPHNPGQFVKIEDAYLVRVAEGSKSRAEAVEHRAVGEHELRSEPDGDARSRRQRQLRLQGHRGAAGQRTGWRVARPALDAVRSRHPPGSGGVERRGIHRLERHQLQRPPSNSSARDGIGTLRQSGRPRLGQSRHGAFRRSALEGPRWQTLRPFAAIVGAVPGNVPLWQSGHSLLHRRHGENPGDARLRADARREE